MNEYFHLHEGCRLVKGAARGAIYDLVGKTVYSVDIKLIELLETASNIGKIVEQAKNKNVTENEIRSQIETLKSLGLGYFHNYDIYRSHLKAENESRVDKIRLLTLTCRIENKCNLRCKHCFSKDSWITDCFCYRSGRATQKVKANEWNEQLSAAYQLGCDNIKIIGGEPFLSNVFNGILSSLTKLRFNCISLYTSGTILRKEWLKLFRDINANILIPIHSCQAEVHEQITRVKGSHSQTVCNIKILRKENISVQAYVILQKENIGHLRDTIDFIKNDLNINYYIDNFYFENLNYNINSKNINYLLKKSPRFSEISLVNFIRRRLGNNCWLNNISIDINGDAIPCIKAKEFVLGNIRETSLNKLINNDNTKKYWYLKKDIIETCSQCEFRYACDDCRLNAFLPDNKLYSKYPLCTYDPLKGEWNHALPVVDDKIADDKRRETQ